MRRAAPKGVAGAAVAAQTTFAMLTTWTRQTDSACEIPGQLEKYAELAEYDFFRRSWPNGGLGSPSWTS